MKKYKLLYFVSEDKYFLTHKISHAIFAKNSGFDVLVVCNLTKYENRIRAKGINVIGVEALRKTVNPLNQISIIIKFLKIIKSFKPDIIQNIALKPILIGSISAIFSKKKIIVINAFVGLGYIYINNNFLTKVLRLITNNILKLISKKKKNFSVFQNLDDQNLFTSFGLVSNKRTFIIRGSGVDTDYFKPKKIQKKKYDVILHSRMLKDKGIFEFVEAIKNINKKKKISALLLGSPDSENLASINKLKLENWNTKKIVNWISYKENVVDYLHQSRIAVLPSYREGLPKSLLEAASCGLPIIATDVVGCKEICIDNFNGILVKTHDSKSIENAIDTILSDKKKLISYSENSRKLVMKHFCVKKISKQFTELYLKLLS